MSDQQEEHLTKQTLAMLAKQTLIIMVLDLQYNNELPATYDHVPIRHNGPWFTIKNLIGKQAMFDEVARLEKAAADGNLPCKTNPRLSYEAQQLHDLLAPVEGQIRVLKWRLRELADAATEALACIPAVRDGVRVSYEADRDKLKAMIDKHKPKDANAAPTKRKD